MEEHIDSHQNAEVGDSNTVYMGNAQKAQISVAPDKTDDSIITWEASEYVQYDKGFEWYASIGGIGILLAVAMFFLVDIGSALVIVFMTIALLVYGRFKPRNLRYTISSHGISVGDKDYAYSEFRSFSVMDNEGILSIFLVPMQRFMIPITMFIAPENQDQVVETLANYLPHQQRKPDFLDKITAMLRF